MKTNKSFKKWLKKVRRDIRDKEPKRMEWLERIRDACNHTEIGKTVTLFS